MYFTADYRWHMGAVSKLRGATKEKKYSSKDEMSLAYDKLPFHVVTELFD